MARPALKNFSAFSVVILVLALISARGQEYRFRHLTITQGLPSNKVNSVIKDKTGFMWFGTDQGLARYDGDNLKVYLIPEDSSFSFGSQAINEVFEDNHGNLWIGTRDNGLMIFDRIREKFTGFLNDPGDPYSLSNNTVNTIHQDREGTLWIGTNGGGINKFNPETGKFISYKHENKKLSGLIDKVTVIFEDDSGSFWIGTRDGLYLFDRKKEMFTRFDIGVEIPAGEYRQINAIIQDHNGILWMGTKWGLFKYDRKVLEIVNYLPADLSRYNKTTQDYSRIIFYNPFNMFVNSLIESGQNVDHALWIATRWGLFRLGFGSNDIEGIFSDPLVPDDLSSTQLNEIYLDEQGQLWIATDDAGVDKLDLRCNNFNRVIMEVPGIDFYYSASSFLVDRNGDLWVGAIDEGLFQYDKDLNYIFNYKKWDFNPDKPFNNRIECLFEDPDENLWLGFFRWGLILFDRAHKEFRQVPLQNKRDAPAPIHIDNIVGDKHRMLWIGTDAGLYLKYLNEDVMAPAILVNHDVLSRARILRIYEDSKSRIWVSTLNNGLYCLPADGRDSLKFIRYCGINDDRSIISGLAVNAIYEDQHGILWLGSDRGLHKLDLQKDTFQSDSLFNDMHPGTIIQIHGDDHDNLWLFHAMKGLIRYSPYAGIRNNLKVFDTGDGLPFDKFNTKFSNTNSFYQSRDGRLFISSAIGTGDGFFWFHPDSIKDNLYIPQVVITSFNVYNQSFLTDSSINFKKHVTLKYFQNFFTFEFAALDFILPEKNQYAYYLEGFENDWIFSGPRGFAIYTGVPPGNYTFRVKGANNDGYWNEEGTSVHISILPPFWETWWAYLIYGLIFISVIYAIVYYYLRRQRLLDRLALQQVQSEKLQELDGLKTRFFTNISHEFRTPLTLILGPVQQLLSKTIDLSDRQNLSIVLQNANRLKDLVNQLLSLSKLESGMMKLQVEKINLTEFARSCMQSFESLASHRKIKLIFSADQSEINAYIDKEKMAQILYNLLSNAFKSTPEEGRIELAISRQPSAVTISITDTGSGIPPDRLPRIFDRFYQVDSSISREQEGTGIGLAIVKEMLKLHHGEIKVESAVGKGTAFRICLPLGREHLREEQIAGSQQTADSSQQLVISGKLLHSIPETRNHKPGIQKLKPKTDAPLLLIVEDNPDMRFFIRGYFEEACQIFEAGNGEEGLSIAIDQIPDIIISDVMMPGMDGYEFCHMVKTDERTCHIPVILLTARASKESRLEGLGTGADDFITKPFDGEELQVRVKNLIEQRRKLSEHYLKAFEAIADQSAEHNLSRDEKFLKKARSVVENHLSDPEFGVEHFASYMALSRVQLHRKLRALVDQSVTEFIRTIRLNYAMILLQNRAGTISEIAYDAGFNNPVWFTISFKKKYGITPSDYLDHLGG